MKLMIGASLALVFAQATPVVRYVDPRGRFEFHYPGAFGDPSPGTDDGFRDRVAAIRFSRLLPSPGRLGGEATLTRGIPLVDLQAAGGLYDAITLQVFSDSARLAVTQALARLTPLSFCQEAVRTQHLDPASPALASLTPQQRTAVGVVDRMRNIEARMVSCLVAGSTVTFDKETAWEPGGQRQHIFGAIRFLNGEYSTFQIVRGSPDAPDQATLDQLTAIVNSWRTLS